MRRAIIAAGLAALVVLPAAAIAEPTLNQGEARADFNCEPGRSYRTACGVLRNNVKVFVRPGRVDERRALVLVGANQPQCGPTYDWIAQRQINARQTGAFQVTTYRNLAGTSACGMVTYGLDLGQGRGDHYRATVTVESDSWVGVGGQCLQVPSTVQRATQNFLECSNAGDKVNVTATSLPMRVEIRNRLPQALRRTDGPYWSNALTMPDSDDAATVPGSGRRAGHSGALRSTYVQKSKGQRGDVFSRVPVRYGAVYRVESNAADPRYDGAFLAISARVLSGSRQGEDASKLQSGSCTVTAPENRAQGIRCKVRFTGSHDDVLTAAVDIGPR